MVQFLLKNVTKNQSRLQKNTIVNWNYSKYFNNNDDANPSQQQIEKLAHRTDLKTIKNRADVRVKYLKKQMNKLVNNFSRLELFIRQINKRLQAEEHDNQNTQSCAY